MKSLAEVIRLGKQLRTIGFDDAPFNHQAGSKVNISGIICTNTRFEGMLWGEAGKDGVDATDVLINMLKPSKFYQQVHAVLLDGIAIGGFNLINLEKLSESLQLPCIAVMRKLPDVTAVKKVLTRFDDAKFRLDTLDAAGEIFTYSSPVSGLENRSFFFQVKGCSVETAGLLLEKVTDTGNVPESLRLAHLIGAAVKTGQSSNSA
ncbi:DUF99 family protein [Thalassomonas actiniarum]|uniref:DUF99 family protein n=1 Tax=Thalassomonas actiniarum TaxID=485447 RepID=A0AAE9YT29_9GAMM|nr:DUF99 family protein [Thalassomonas actiniarum]WDE00262.1 DUF99 family protein [Thalassomonas actiniarum]